jgi:succinyl-diaminopimelate desuccinylase
MEKDFDALWLTKKLVTFNTINPPGAERNAARHLGELLKEFGFEVSFHDFDTDRTSVVARLLSAPGRPSLCFTGHLDTVPLGSVAWRTDPFGGEIDGDRMYGRGTSDMKGGVAAMVTAALRLARSPKAGASLVLILTAGEETGSKGAAHLVSLRGLGPIGAMVVGEPTSNYPLVGHKGALWIEAQVKGVSAHGSMPEKGVNAIYKAARAVVQLEAYQFGVPPHPLLGLPTLNVGTISGGTNVNLVPDRTTIGIDIRTIPGQHEDAILKSMQAILGSDSEIKKVLSVGGVATDPQNEWVQEVFNIVAPFLGGRPIPQAATYFTDASFLTPALGNPPTIILGPGESEMVYKTDEYCLVSRIELAREIYYEIAKKWIETAS